MQTLGSWALIQISPISEYRSTEFSERDVPETARAMNKKSRSKVIVSQSGRIKEPTRLAEATAGGLTVFRKRSS